jgi:hypothetical protein
MDEIKRKRFQKVLNLSINRDLAFYDALEQLITSVDTFNENFKGVDLSNIEVIEGPQGIQGEKGDKGEKGDSPDQELIIKKITDILSKRIRQPRDGKDAIVNYDYIIGEILSILPIPKDGVDGKDGKNGKDGSPDTPNQIVSKINQATDQIEAKHIKDLPNAVERIVEVRGMGFTETQLKAGSNITVGKDSSGAWVITSTGGTGGGHTIQDEGVDLTQRTKLNFVGAGVTVTDDSGNDATVVTISTSSGAGYQAPLTGAVDGSNATFTWATAPNALSVDGKIIRKTASDTTVNWTGTTTTILTIAPNFDIFGVA